MSRRLEDDWEEVIPEDPTIEQLIDEILNTHLQDFKAGHDDKFRDSFLQLLNEAEDKYKDYKSPQEVSALLNKAMVDTRAFLKGELTPKENK